MGSLDGKVALITGAARGLGRSHAQLLASMGANVIAVDLCGDIETVDYSLPSPAELAATALLVEEAGGRAVVRQADVRDLAAMTEAVTSAVGELGRLDIVIANAGIGPANRSTDDPLLAWTNVIDVNLTGTWVTVHAARQALIDGGRGGSVVLTSSTAGLKGAAGRSPGAFAYIASKHGVVGLMRAFAIELGPHGIRVNSIHPTVARTPLVDNDAMRALMAERGGDEARRAQHVLPVAMIEPIDVSNAVAWLVSDEARYVTGVTLPVDAGYLVR